MQHPPAPIFIYPTLFQNITGGTGLVQEGTRTWSAPEVLSSFRDTSRRGRISVQADVYSFGVVAWEIVTQADPLQGWHDIRCCLPALSLAELKWLLESPLPPLYLA